MYQYFYSYTGYGVFLENHLRHLYPGTSIYILILLTIYPLLLLPSGWLVFNVMSDKIKHECEQHDVQSDLIILARLLGSHDG